MVAKTPAPKPSPVGSVATFLSRLKALGPPATGVLRTFRGMRDVSWKIEPGLFREDRKTLLAHERDAIRELMAVRSADFSADQSMFDRLVRMQHFGLPTRLLDVSANPLVSLYFATEEVDERLEDTKNGIVVLFDVPPQRKKYFDSDTISCIANLAALSNDEKSEISASKPKNLKEFHALESVDRLLQFIKAEKPYFRESIKREELDRIWYVVPKLNNARIIAQSGAFMIFGVQPINRMGTHLIETEVLVVAAGKKKAIRAELRELGIDQRNLFPEIDKAAGYIVDQYR